MKVKISFRAHVQILYNIHHLMHKKLKVKARGGVTVYTFSCNEINNPTLYICIRTTF